MIPALRNRSAHWRILTDSAAVAVCLAIVKAAGALKVVILARAFGATDALDAYLMAFLLPSFLGETLTGSLPAALIPALIGVREQFGKPAMHRLIAGIAAAAILLLSTAALLLIAGSPVLLQLVAAGFSPQKRELTQQLFLMLSPMIPLSGLSIVWRAALNTEESFAIAALAPGCTPLLIIGVLSSVGPGAGVWILASATVAGMVLELTGLAWGMRQTGLPMLPRWRGWDPQIRSVARQHLPLIAVATIGNGTVLVDQSMAATLGPGSVSTLNYGSRLSSVLSGIAGGALSAVTLPQFSGMVATGDWTGLRRTLRTYYRLIAAIAIPGALLLIGISPWLVRILFQRGAFTAQDASLVSDVQRIAMVQAPLVIVNALLFRVVSSMQASAQLVRMALGALLLTVAGDYALRQWFGLPGIAITGVGVQSLMLVYLWFIVKTNVRRQAAC